MTLLSALLPLLGASISPVPTAPPATAPIRLWMNNDGRFREGEYVRVQVDADADGYLLVLQYDTFGKLRVLFPLDPRDDNRVIRGRRYEVQDDGGRFAFRADGDGPGLIYSAITAEPWRLEGIVADGRWDNDRLTINPDAEDPEPAITELVQRLAGPGGFDYDLLDYRVYGATPNSTSYGYGQDYVYGYEPYRQCNYYWSFGGCGSFRFGLYYGYDPFYYGYSPYRSSYYYPYYSPYYYPRGSITVRPRVPSAIVSGRPRAYNVTPFRPRGNVTSRPIDWRNRDFNTTRPSRPSGWNAPAARPSRPPSERRDFRGETRDRGRDGRQWNAPSGNRGNNGWGARGNNNGGGRSSPPPRASRPRRP